MVATLFIKLIIIIAIAVLAVGVVAMFLNRELDEDIAKFYVEGFDVHRSKTLSQFSQSTIDPHRKAREHSYYANHR